MFGRATIRLGIGPHSSFVNGQCKTSVIKTQQVTEVTWKHTG